MMEVKEEVVKQLSNYQGWAKGVENRPFSLLDYVGCVATADSFFGFADLFSPHLSIHEGRYFLASAFSVDVYRSWVVQGQTPRQIQRVMNHLHVSTLIQGQTLSDEVANEVARVLAEVWSLTLRKYGVSVEVVGQGLADAAVTFSSE